MKLQIVAATACVATLSACGGTHPETAGDDPTTGDPTASVTYTDAPLESRGAASVVLEGSQTTRIAYDSTNDELIVESIPFDGEVFPSQYERNAAADVGRYQAFQDKDGFEDYDAHYGTTDSGAASVAVVTTGGYSDHGYYGAGYQRHGSVNLPGSTQKGFYTGDYIAHRTVEDGRSGSDVITGQSELEVDFSDAAVRGRIHNRQITVNETGEPITGTIIFRDTDLNRAGADFHGEVFTNDTGSVVDVGEYHGVLAGQDAVEAAGVVQISDGVWQETGVFTAKQ